MKINYFKLGSILYMVLGTLHTLSHLLNGASDDSQLTDTLAKMEAASFQFMGEHTLMQFYNGFSLTMGFLLFAFGLQAYMINQPDKRIIVTDILISMVILLLTVIYFHLLASAFAAAATICFTISLFGQRTAKD